MVDLPAPIMPTSTTERRPSADVMSASWVGLAWAGAAVSDIENSVDFAGFARGCDTYTTPIDAPARGSCHGDGNMLDDFIG